MKLAIVLGLLIGVAAPSIANADILSPPSGPVDESEVDIMPARNGGGARMRQRDPQQMVKRQRLRQALLEQFDANGDGKLGPRERLRAARMLRRIEQRLTAPMRQGARANQYRRFMKRYDVNGDGQVGPREVPQGAADRLRRFDSNRDGWVEPGEL